MLELFFVLAVVLGVVLVIALPFMIFGWLMSGLGLLLAGPIVLLALLVPLALVLLGVGALLLVALSPALVVGGGLWLVARAVAGGGSRA